MLIPARDETLPGGPPILRRSPDTAAEAIATHLRLVRLAERAASGDPGGGGGISGGAIAGIVIAILLVVGLILIALYYRRRGGLPAAPFGTSKLHPPPMPAPDPAFLPRYNPPTQPPFAHLSHPRTTIYPTGTPSHLLPPVVQPVQSGNIYYAQRHGPPPGVRFGQVGAYHPSGGSA
ncbi:hypothetical protein DB88DRAFT_524131 [Papiliotrema laurentii]|uniref:Uncharacterized protein n=1 Tax=Papiliotrema laurentii TaxID=5418 RepID=A0AAD9L715_PAPLA|nr:hypothetical protein DB88DRAFT_524131 [Papiliotrema laurentii]